MQFFAAVIPLGPAPITHTRLPMAQLLPDAWGGWKGDSKKIKKNVQ